MSDERVVVMEMTRIEAGHLADLVRQFADLVSSSDSAGHATQDDPAIARLVPDAYPDDAESGREFRTYTEDGLLRRRADDAGAVLATLGDAIGTGVGAADALDPFIVALDADQTSAWLRTLAALRLVLASRLGIETEDDHDEDDPRFGIYDWLGYRLDGLVNAIDA
jgi:hypothetical protein